MRITLQDVANSNIPRAIGLAPGDLQGLSAYVNEAQQRLINAGGESGWWGSWAKIAYDMEQSDPYFTLPQGFARAAGIDVCRTPIRIQNEWYEFMADGIGYQIPCSSTTFGWGNGPFEAYERQNVCTAYDLTTTNQYIRVYATDTRDTGKRIGFLQALDSNGNGIYTTDESMQVDGFFLRLDYTTPATTTYIVTAFGGIQKDITYGDVIVKQVDATTGDEVLLARYRPWETAPSYRRYYINRAPNKCCGSTTETTFQVSVMAMYDYKPAYAASDWILIGNIPALKAECQSIWYGEKDSPEAAQMSLIKHNEAIKLLNDELTHYMGKQQPAVNFAPFGFNSPCERQIGYIV